MNKGVHKTMRKTKLIKPIILSICILFLNIFSLGFASNDSATNIEIDFPSVIINKGLIPIEHVLIESIELNPSDKITYDISTDSNVHVCIEIIDDKEKLLELERVRNIWMGIGNISGTIEVENQGTYLYIFTVSNPFAGGGQAYKESNEETYLIGSITVEKEKTEVKKPMTYIQF